MRREGREVAEGNSEEWMKSKGREFNPERDSAGLSCRRGDIAGGGKRGAFSGSACGNEGGWVLTQLVEELSNCSHNVMAVGVIRPSLEACKIMMTVQRAQGGS